MRTFFRLAALSGLACLCAIAQAQTCNQPAAAVTAFTALPGAPFAAVASADGCVIFVSLSKQNSRDQGHIGVLQRRGGTTTLAHDIAVAGSPSGMSLSHDGRVLAVSNQTGVALFDTTRLLSGDGTPIVTANDQAAGAADAGSVYTAISKDDKLLFVSDESAAAITVYDLPKLRTGMNTAIGRIPTGIAPVGLAFSPDGRRLYATSELLPSGRGAARCPPAGAGGAPTPQGALTVVDVAKAARDPAASILATIPAGCDPVRVTLSTDGTLAFVAARGQNSLLIFDTSKLVADSDHALLIAVRTGEAPVGVAVASGAVFVANSNRFAPAGRKGEWLTIIDPNTARIIGSLQAGLVPRELQVTPDGHTLMVTNFGSSSLEMIDLSRLNDAYFAQQKSLKDADDAAQARIQTGLEERTRNHQELAGTEAALRHVIEGLEAGAPDYTAMTPDTAAVARQNAAAFAAIIQKFGMLRSITFKAAAAPDADLYEVVFEHVRTDWTIMLTPNGKIGNLNFRPAN